MTDSSPRLEVRQLVNSWCVAQFNPALFFQHTGDSSHGLQASICLLHLFPQNL